MKRTTICRWIAVSAICVTVSGCSLFNSDSNHNENSVNTSQPVNQNQNGSSHSNDTNQDVKDITFSSAELERGVVYQGEKIDLSVAAVSDTNVAEATTLEPGNIRFETDQPDWLTIDDNGTLTVSDQAPIGSSATITAHAHDLSVSANVTIKYSLKETLLPASSNGIPVVTNADSYAVLVNKQRSLPDGHKPDDLVEPSVPFSFDEWDEKRQLRKEATDALESLFAQAKDDGISLRAVSGYRSYERQNYLFNMYVETQGEEHARRFSAVPGTSEHQTGLAMDVSSASVGYALQQSFGDTKEGKWLADNAHKHGFIIRYPNGKEDITGYAYEPWHIRYVGKEIAADIYEQDITLEEYFGEAVPVTGN